MSGGSGYDLCRWWAGQRTGTGQPAAVLCTRETAEESDNFCPPPSPPTPHPPAPSTLVLPGLLTLRPNTEPSESAYSWHRVHTSRGMPLAKSLELQGATDVDQEVIRNPEGPCYNFPHQMWRRAPSETHGLQNDQRKVASFFRCDMLQPPSSRPIVEGKVVLPVGTSRGGEPSLWHLQSAMFALSGACNACSGHGRCRDGPLGDGTCECLYSAADGFFEGDRCDRCHSGYGCCIPLLYLLWIHRGDGSGADTWGCMETLEGGMKTFF